MAMPIEERRARDRARQMAKNHAKALAAGRELGRIGHPRATDEARAAWRKRAYDKQNAKAHAVRSAERAARALAEGRVPGRPGKKRVLVTDDQRKAAAKHRAAKYRAGHLDDVRARDVANSARRAAALRATDPVAYKLSCAARAAAYRAKQAGGCSPKGLTAIVRRVWNKAAGHCAACNAAGDLDLELDHIVAVANGGDNSEQNFQFLCMPCNRSKSDKDYDTWLQSRRLAA